jgi:hypothetical protein
MEAPVMYDAFGEATKAIKTTGFFIALLLEWGPAQDGLARQRGLSRKPPDRRQSDAQAMNGPPLARSSSRNLVLARLLNLRQSPSKTAEVSATL